jgi:hypothetical protein
MITQDIDKTDLLLSGFLTYVRVTTPIRKVNTVNALVEEVLEKNKVPLEKKGAHLFRKLKEDLPEIIVPDDQLKYILDFVLQYAILSMPPGGNIALLTTSVMFQGEIPGAQAFFEKYGGYIEISVVFSGDREPAGLWSDEWGRTSTPQKGEPLELMLRLVKGMVLKNWGKMNFETDEKSRRTTLSLKFPIERRKVVSCEPHGINLSASHLES